ncbi:MAG: hypothetical protein E7453_05355 [Ruminococcaceae bacterium]|nr:hypothetical protein [Oscillospiraceae bacterium]
MLNTCAQLFVDDLNSKDMNFGSGNNGDVSFVEFPYQGKVAKLLFSGENGEYLSIYLVYERVPEEKFADMVLTCNEMNCMYKWVTFYVDSDSDLILHDDAILSVENAADEAFELLVRILKIGEEVKPKIMRTIYA